MDINDFDTGNCKILYMDLGQLDSIDSFVMDIEKSFGIDSIDIVSLLSLCMLNNCLISFKVINNAGMVNPYMLLTSEGFEQSFGVNFLGTAYFIQALVDKQIIPKGGNIMVIVSESHYASMRLNETTVQPFGHPWGKSNESDLIMNSIILT